jgi:hypothetical protein
MTAILTRVRWSPNAVLSCVSLVAKDAERFCHALIGYGTSSFVSYPLSSIAHLLVGLLALFV